MAKFNKDAFFNDITTKVQNAIDKDVITNEDRSNNDLDRLHKFIQYQLIDFIQDRKFAIDVLKDFNYDERTEWSELQETFGEFQSLMDIAVINLWKYIESQGATSYEFYKHDNKYGDKPMLDQFHYIEDEEGEENQAPNNDMVGDNDSTFDDFAPEPPVQTPARRKIVVNGDR